MPRIGAPLLVALVLASGAVQAQQVKTLWNCKDAKGRTTLTDQKADTVGKECRVVSEERISTVPAPKMGAKSPTPANFPRESAADRASSKAKQRDTIEKELTQEEALLADARKKLSEQEAIRTGDEKNFAKAMERIKPFKDTVEVHEKNVEALKRELGNLSR